MLSSFKNRLYFAAIILFIGFLLLSFFVYGFVSGFKNRSYTQLVLGSTMVSLMRVNRDITNLIYLTKLRKSEIALNKLRKRKLNISKIDSVIKTLKFKISKARKNNILSINGFYSGFSHENFKTLYGIKKNLLKRPSVFKTPAMKLKVERLKRFMKYYRPYVVKLLKNPYKIGPKSNISFFKNGSNKIISYLDYFRHNISDSMAKKMTTLLNMFLFTPFLILIVLLLTVLYFKKYLIDEIQTVVKFIKKVSGGDLTSKINLKANPKSETGMLIYSINSLIDSLLKNVGSISSAAKSISTSGVKFNDLSKELKKNMDNMKQDNTSITESIKQITQAILEVAKNSANGAQEADKTQKATQDGYSAVKEVISNINSIENAVDKVGEVMGELEQSSQRIGEIISVIDDIADQTNLLALNAAIEAARAGDQGRGFAVVADEVKKLAERTTKATKEITEMIKSIQVDSKKASDSMDTGKAEVKNGVNSAEKAGEKIKIIMNLADKLKDMITQIAAAAEEQSTATEEISGSTDSILKAGELNSISVEQIYSNSIELSKLSEKLSSEINMFKI